MKRFIMPVLLIALLCGCGSDAPMETSVPTEPVIITEPTEPAGIYIPGSDLEVLTHGAVRMYVPEFADCYAMDTLDGDVLLFSGEEFTTLTRLTGDNLYPIAQAQLDSFVYPEDTSFQISDKGITYFDELSGTLVFLDNDLDEVSRIPVPQDMVGTPVLSSNRLKLYYCTADAVRVLDLETGLDMLLKQIAYSYQSVEGILFGDTVLQCYVEDEEGQTIFLSTQTGELLGEPQENLVMSGESDTCCYAVLQEGIMQELVFGGLEEEPRMLIPEDPFGSVWYLEKDNSAVTSSYSDETTDLDYYDLSSGMRKACLEIPEELLLWYVKPAVDDSRVYMMGCDPDMDCAVIYRWDLTITAINDGTVYVGPWYTLENPDLEGLAACAGQAAEIGERYGLDVLIGLDAVDVQPWDYEMVAEYQVPVIRRELEKLEFLLDVYPDGFFETIDEDIKVCLVRSVQGSAESGSLDTANGIQFWESGKAYVVLTAGDTLDKTLYHELFHVIDNHVLSVCSAYYDWERLNPQGFTYDLDYITNQERDPGQYLEDENRAFIDAYSMSYPKEDRARIMEYAATAGNAHYFESEIMQKKLRTLCTGIREAFDLREYPLELIWEQYLQEPLI